MAECLLDDKHTIFEVDIIVKWARPKKAATSSRVLDPNAQDV